MSVRPVAGPRFRQVHRLPLPGKKKKLLALIAAYQDAGYEPSVRDLLSGGHFNNIWDVDRLLLKLEKINLLSVERRQPLRNRYTLHLNQAARSR
jgi:hypothetical protein